MARFDRYLLSQLTVLFGFFALVLVLIYWVNRAVRLFDQLVANGESILVFLEFTALTLPSMIAAVVPFAALAAAVFVTNRLSSESELVVVEAAGYSPFRLARPVLAFGLIAGLFVALLTHVLVPSSQQRLAERQAEIAQNITARFLSQGSFEHPANGITLYIREITPEGELRDLFLTDTRDVARHVTYTAQRALVVRSETGPKLVMFDGLAQVLSTGDSDLITTTFEDFTYDLGALIDQGMIPALTLRTLSTADLLAATPAMQRVLNAPRAVFLAEAHERTGQAAMVVVASLVGFSVLMLGSFSRFGLWRQMLGAAVLFILLLTLDNTMVDTARSDDRGWVLIYLTPLVGLVVCAAVLWVSARPALFARRSKLPAPPVEVPA
ncbi:LPS export ABC transporter permease LptF [Aliiroseovarius sp.]|uniref:LPS export ABC transporter permease LptF n=1 Tax=Aliiroseovarius sp. TaxID=1872442 RepID=UPI002620879E|nr:LPS export ABC transporter permease LptF [Aliiroseovarius sp.]